MEGGVGVDKGSCSCTVGHLKWQVKEFRQGFTHWAGVIEAEAFFETGISSISVSELAHL